MAAFTSRSGMSSGVASLADLDYYTFPISDYSSSHHNNQVPSNHEDFAFDPPSNLPAYPKNESHHSPDSQNDSAFSSAWPGFEIDEDNKQDIQAEIGILNASSSGWSQNRSQTKSRSGPSAVLSRYGQVTPPRSNSASSVDMAKEENLSPKKTTPRKKKNKTQLNESEPSSSTTKPPRKRKSSRKSTASTAESAHSPEDDKRKMSLEKNRVAAAKCRVNKKEKTEQMQKDSHEKAVQNAFLKESIMRMKEEIQHMNTLLLAHSNSEGCCRPDEIHKRLRHMGNTLFSQNTSQPYGTYNSIREHMRRLNQNQIEQGDYFCRSVPEEDPAMLSNPPLPEYNQSADFDLQTPQPAP